MHERQWRFRLNFIVVKLKQQWASRRFASPGKDKSINNNMLLMEA